MNWFEKRDYLHKWAAGYLLADETNPEPELSPLHSMRQAINAVFGSTNPRETLRVVGLALDALDERLAVTAPSQSPGSDTPRPPGSGG